MKVEQTPFQKELSVSKEIGQIFGAEVDTFIRNDGGVTRQLYFPPEGLKISSQLGSGEAKRMKKKYYSEQEELRQKRDAVSHMVATRGQSVKIRDLVDRAGHWTRTTKKGNPRGPGSHSTRHVAVPVRVRY